MAATTKATRSNAVECSRTWRWLMTVGEGRKVEPAPRAGGPSHPEKSEVLASCPSIVTSYEEHNCSDDRRQYRLILYYVDSYSADIPQVQPQTVSCRDAPYSLCPLIGDCAGVSCSLQNDDDIQELPDMYIPSESVSSTLAGAPMVSNQYLLGQSVILASGI